MQGLMAANRESEAVKALLEGGADVDVKTKSVCLTMVTNMLRLSITDIHGN